MLLEGPRQGSAAPPLNEILSRGLEAHADATALVSIVRSMTWQGLERESSVLAGGYRRIGLRRGIGSLR